MTNAVLGRRRARIAVTDRGCARRVIQPVIVDDLW
jgi:hypothetical protein